MSTERQCGCRLGELCSFHKKYPGEPKAMSTPKPTAPFYWTKPCDPGEAGVYVAPSGWYQWTREGLKYLGESILTPLTSEQEKK